MTKDIYVLGINDGHLATATLIKNGEIISCVSEERFTGIKNQSGIPVMSIDYCLDSANIDFERLNSVVFGGKLLPPTTSEPNGSSDLIKIVYLFIKVPLKLFRFISIYFPIFRKVEENIYPAISKIIEPIIQQKRINNLMKYFKADKRKVVFLDHHTAHIYSGVFASSFVNKHKSLLVFTCDGEGDGLSATVSTFINNKLHIISRTSMTNSLGNLYRSVTKYLGMKPLEHEYKVMGLAAYVSNTKTNDLLQSLKKLFSVDKDTLQIQTSVNSQLFKMGYLNRLFKEKRFDDISYATQELTEKILVEWIKTAINRTSITNIILSGGVFMNVKANQKISEIKEIRNIFIMPSCGDESNAIGAAYYGYKKITNKNPRALNNLYLGPKYSDSDIETAAHQQKYKQKIRISKPKNMAKVVASLLKKGYVIARSSGRMEWGARALGNRSILADPTNLEIVQKINRAIKCRDFWMPFAPVIMSDKHTKYVLNKKGVKAPYMIITFDTTLEGQSDLKAAIHQYDKTARPQLLDISTNPEYYSILKEFSKITGRFGLLNTSFNLHGYPIVNTPDDALHTFINSGLDYLILNDYLIEKRRTLNK